jgi:hypothetical protein
VEVLMTVLRLCRILVQQKFGIAHVAEELRNNPSSGEVAEGTWKHSLIACNNTDNTNNTNATGNNTNAEVAESLVSLMVAEGRRNANQARKIDEKV